MNLREEYYRTRQLQAIAGQTPVPAAAIARLIQPFIDKYKNLRLPRRPPSAPADRPPSAPTDRPLSAPAGRTPAAAAEGALSAAAAPPSGAGGGRRHVAHDLILRKIGEAGVGCRREGLKGLAFHNTLQRKVAELAGEFGYRGFMECYASYDTDEMAEHPGRMDVVWAAERTPVVLFELDSTVKRISLRKLQLSEGEHKFWIYFGPDVWGFKTNLAKWDAEREVVPVIIPRSFVPVAARREG